MAKGFDYWVISDLYCPPQAECCHCQNLVDKVVTSSNEAAYDCDKCDFKMIIWENKYIETTDKTTIISNG